MQQKEFMQEFVQVILNRVKDQAFSVILLIIALIYFGYEKNNLKKTDEEHRVQLSEFSKQLMSCEINRMGLTKELEMIKDRLSEGKKTRR